MEETSELPGLITLTTDFGVGSPYVAAMKGVILSLCPRATIVDITHAIGPQNVRQGAWTLADTAPFFPAGTVHVAVVDPGVGSRREIVYARFGRQHFVAPDNGLLSRLALDSPPSRIIAIREPAYWRPEVSHTFHGRDIMAPVAAWLCRGTPPEKLGPPLAGLITLDWPEVTVLPGKITGAVRSIDSFGNLITDITEQALADAPRDETVRVACDEHETLGIYRAYSDQPPQTLVALVGSGGALELAIVGESAADMLGIGVGEKVTVRW